MEWGTWERNRETGQMTVTQTFDENGDTGLTDFVASGPASLSLEIGTDSLVASFDEDKNGEVDGTM